MEILAAVKGSGKEKRLASQFIAKFFTSFPNLSDQAIEAQFDLCEDDDVAVIITYFYQLTIRKSIFICIFVKQLFIVSKCYLYTNNFRFESKLSKIYQQCVKIIKNTRLELLIF